MNNLLLFIFLSMTFAISCNTKPQQKNSTIRTTKKIEDPRIEKQIINNILQNKNGALIIHVPKTNVTAKLNKLKAEKKTDKIIGSYVDGQQSGNIILDQNKLTIISKVSRKQNKVYYAAPFYFSNSDNKPYAYIGLFEYDLSTKKSQHLDSYFLADKIDGLQLSDEIQAINVKFLKLARGQSSEEAPIKMEKIQLGISSKPLKFVNNSLDLYPSINIHPLQVVNSPLEIKINSKGLWQGSEGELGYIELTDEYGNKLGQYGIMVADGEWMKTGPVNYSTTLRYETNGKKTGKLIIHNNPGPGDGQEAGEIIQFEIPIILN